MTNIALIIANPFTGSLDHGLAEAYRTAAIDAGSEVRVIDLATTSFDLTPPNRGALRVPDLDHAEALDPVVRDMANTLIWANHLTFVYPVWWGTYPAALKGFIDRVFISGVAYRYGTGARDWERLLAGRTARLLLTMDSPTLWHRLKYRGVSESSLKTPLLWYCGVRTIGTTRFDQVRFSTDDKRSAWLADAARLGTHDAGLLEPVTVG